MAISYRARVCGGSRLDHYTTCVQPREKMESVSHVWSAFNDKFRYNNRIARETMARCYVAQQGIGFSSHRIPRQIDEGIGS